MKKIQKVILVGSYGGFIWFDFSGTIKIDFYLTTGLSPFVSQTKKDGLVLPVEIDLELVMEVVTVDPPSDPFLEFINFRVRFDTFLVYMW